MKAQYNNPLLWHSWAFWMYYNIQLPKYGAFNFGFKFWRVSLNISVFIKLMLFNIFLLINHLKSRSHGYMYGIRNITMSFQRLHQIFGLINNSNECLNYFLCIGPTHNACNHLPFRGDYLLKFQFIINYVVNTLKNLISEMKMIKMFTWLMNMVQNMWNHM